MPTQSPEVARILAELDGLERAIAGFDVVEHAEDPTLIALEKRRELMTAALAREPTLSPGDLEGKLSILCSRLRYVLDPNDTPQVITCMLAESLRPLHGGLCPSGGRE